MDGVSNFGVEREVQRSVMGARRLEVSMRRMGEGRVGEGEGRFVKRGKVEGDEVVGNVEWR